ncbi:hypothetical protein [Streptomyces sp. NPDC005077]|uniref:hypothetical protein n=1 Tax=Streptomyces sp. NPDC005077 TaxID=3154292 RepID=UPI0033BC12AE
MRTRLRPALLAATTLMMITGCSEEEAVPGPIASEQGHTYSAEQSAYLRAVRDLNWPAGATEKDALFAALASCIEAKKVPFDEALAAHEVSEKFGLEPEDADTVLVTASVLCMKAEGTQTP